MAVHSSHLEDLHVEKMMVWRSRVTRIWNTNSSCPTWSFGLTLATSDLITPEDAAIVASERG